jgi:hypothetical protein
MEKIEISQEEKDRMDILSDIELFELCGTYITAKDFIYRVVNRQKFINRRSPNPMYQKYLDERFTEEYIYRQLYALSQLRPRTLVGQHIYLAENMPLSSLVKNMIFNTDEEGNDTHKTNTLELKTETDDKTTLAVQELKELLIDNIYSVKALKGLCFCFHQQSKHSGLQLRDFPNTGRPIILVAQNTTDTLQRVDLFNDEAIPQGV